VGFSHATNSTLCIHPPRPPRCLHPHGSHNTSYDLRNEFKKGASYQFMATSTLPKTFSSASIASLYEYMDKDFSNRENQSHVFTQYGIVHNLLSKMSSRSNVDSTVRYGVSVCLQCQSRSPAARNRKSSELRNYPLF
jgi:hypothetical protein